MGKISVVINTLDEERKIKRAIDSVKSIADEIIVVDMHSSDKTVDIAKKLGAKVFSHKKMGYVEPARNYAISKASNKWILILDADETISDKLGKKLKELAEKETDYYRLPRKNIVFGKWLKYSRWWPDFNIRFFKKGSVTWDEVIHSVPMTTGKGEELEAKEENSIIHFHYENIDEYLTRMMRYSTVQSNKLSRDGYKFSWKDLVVNPSNEFFSRYFFGKGYKDGIHGLAVALLQSFSEFVTYLRVWEGKKYEDINITVGDANTTFSNIEKDLNYWKADTLVNENGNLISRLKRKFKLR